MGDSYNNPISFKYLTGWGDASDLTPLALSSEMGVAEILKNLKKANRKDREYIRDKWRDLYLFYVNALFEEPDQPIPLNDGYLKKLDRELDLS